MGYKNRAEQETTLSYNSSSLSDALLLATMCIIGLPVEVYVKDGSVYSGIFYTASVEKDYGIVLKKAKMTKKGKSNANVTNGTVIETLVIFSADLVQVVAKGVQLPADDIPGNYAGNDVEAVGGTGSSIEGQISEGKRHIRSGMNKRRNQKRISVRNENGYFHCDGPTKAEKAHEEKKLSLNIIRNAVEVEHGKRDGIGMTKIEEAPFDLVNGRQVGDDKLQSQQDSCTQTFEFCREGNVDGVQGSSSNLGACQDKLIPAEGEHPNMTFKHPIGVSHDPAHELDKPDNQCRERPSSADTSSVAAACSSVSTSSDPIIDVTSGICCSSSAATTEVVPPQSSQSNKSTKEFKLNPGAKIFSPSFANSTSATPPAIPTVTSMAYMPNNSPVLSVAAAQSEVGISSCVRHSSVPAKFVPYGNLTAGNGGNVSQFSQPIVGHVGSRTQPVRYAGQYPVQAGPACVHPNSQAVMFGRVGGQLVYMQPVSNIVVLAKLQLRQLSGKDLVQGVAAISQVSAQPALTAYQVQFPKHQGNAAGQTLQLCVPSPLVGSGQQHFPAPSHIPVLQPPVPANRPIPVPGSNGLYSTKFP